MSFWLFALFFSSCFRAHPHLHSFPTRRSSDLSGRQTRALSGAPKLLKSPHIGPSSPPAHRRRGRADVRSEEHTSELQSLTNHVCRLLLGKKNSDEAAVDAVDPLFARRCRDVVA